MIEGTLRWIVLWILLLFGGFIAGITWLVTSEGWDLAYSLWEALGWM